MSDDLKLELLCNSRCGHLRPAWPPVNLRNAGWQRDGFGQRPRRRRAVWLPAASVTATFDHGAQFFTVRGASGSKSSRG